MIDIIYQKYFFTKNIFFNSQRKIHFHKERSCFFHKNIYCLNYSWCIYHSCFNWNLTFCCCNIVNVPIVWLILDYFIYFYLSADLQDSFHHSSVVISQIDQSLIQPQDGHRYSDNHNSVSNLFNFSVEAPEHRFRLRRTGRRDQARTRWAPAAACVDINSTFPAGVFKMSRFFSQFSSDDESFCKILPLLIYHNTEWSDWTRCCSW